MHELVNDTELFDEWDSDLIGASFRCLYLVLVLPGTKESPKVKFFIFLYFCTSSSHVVTPALYVC